MKFRRKIAVLAKTRERFAKSIKQHLTTLKEMIKQDAANMFSDQARQELEQEHWFSDDKGLIPDLRALRKVHEQLRAYDDEKDDPTVVVSAGQVQVRQTIETSYLSAVPAFKQFFEPFLIEEKLTKEYLVVLEKVYARDTSIDKKFLEAFTEQYEGDIEKKYFFILDETGTLFAELVKIFGTPQQATLVKNAQFPLLSFSSKNRLSSEEEYVFQVEFAFNCVATVTARFSDGTTQEVGKRSNGQENIDCALQPRGAQHTYDVLIELSYSLGSQDPKHITIPVGRYRVTYYKPQFIEYFPHPYNREDVLFEGERTVFSLQVPKEQVMQYSALSNFTHIKQVQVGNRKKLPISVLGKDAHNQTQMEFSLLHLSEELLSTTVEYTGRTDFVIDFSIIEQRFPHLSSELLSLDVTTKGKDTHHDTIHFSQRANGRRWATQYAEFSSDTLVNEYQGAKQSGYELEGQPIVYDPRSIEEHEGRLLTNPTVSAAMLWIDVGEREQQIQVHLTRDGTAPLSVTAEGSGVLTLIINTEYIQSLSSNTQTLTGTIALGEEQISLPDIVVHPNPAPPQPAPKQPEEAAPTTDEHPFAREVTHETTAGPPADGEPVPEEVVDESRTEPPADALTAAETDDQVTESDASTPEPGLRSEGERRMDQAGVKERYALTDEQRELLK